MRGMCNKMILLAKMFENIIGELDFFETLFSKYARLNAYRNYLCLKRTLCKLERENARYKDRSASS